MTKHDPIEHVVLSERDVAAWFDVAIGEVRRWRNQGMPTVLASDYFQKVRPHKPAYPIRAITLWLKEKGLWGFEKPEGSKTERRTEEEELILHRLREGAERSRIRKELDQVELDKQRGDLVALPRILDLLAGLPEALRLPIEQLQRTHGDDAAQRMNDAIANYRAKLSRINGNGRKT